MKVFNFQICICICCFFMSFICRDFLFVLIVKFVYLSDRVFLSICCFLHNNNILFLSQKKKKIVIVRAVNLHTTDLFCVKK